MLYKNLVIINDESYLFVYFMDKARFYELYLNFMPYGTGAEVLSWLNNLIELGDALHFIGDPISNKEKILQQQRNK